MDRGEAEESAGARPRPCPPGSVTVAPTLAELDDRVATGDHSSMGIDPELGSLEWRVAAHAALGDASRLRVVDAVGVGDAGPSDLARSLGMSSNLLAHHLKVLEAAGLVRRAPSESDGRRSYVRLVPGAFEVLGRVPGAPVPDGRVVFVCSGNSARSQLAAAVWASRGLRAASAGTHPAPRIHPGAVRVARRHGVTLLDSRPRATDEVLCPDDVIVTVCDAADREVVASHVHWSVPDPVAVGSDRAFESAFRQISDRISAWVGRDADSVQPDRVAVGPSGL